jgi:hypothetical protein
MIMSEYVGKICKILRECIQSLLKKIILHEKIILGLGIQIGIRINIRKSTYTSLQ